MSIRPQAYLRDHVPILAQGDLVAFLGASGFKKAAEGGSGIYVVESIEPTLHGLSQHGVLVVWADSGSAPAGYLADAGMQATTNHLTSGQIYDYQLQNLVLTKGQFARLRFRLKFFATVTGTVDDYDILFFTGPTERGSYLHIAGVMNSMFQVQDPGDSIVAPAQGANITLPAVFPQSDPATIWDVRTQQFILETGSIGVGVRNNGSGTTSGGAIGLEISGEVYTFSPVENYQNITMGDARQLIPSVPALPWPNDLLSGRPVDPRSIMIVQTEGRAAS